VGNIQPWPARISSGEPGPKPEKKNQQIGPLASSRRHQFVVQARNRRIGTFWLVDWYNRSTCNY
jgi:hypothetical protein